VNILIGNDAIFALIGTGPGCSLLFTPGYRVSEAMRNRGMANIRTVFSASCDVIIRS